jgi:hypothetical protein
MAHREESADAALIAPLHGDADKPWTYQAFNQALIRLEHRAGVPHVAYRGAHGFRRYVINDVNARNLVLAGQYVGDKDLRTLMRSYVSERPESCRRGKRGLRPVDDASTPCNSRCGRCTHHRHAVLGPVWGALPRASDAHGSVPNARRPVAKWHRARPVPTRTGDP